jgi:transcription elongation factor Elf1
MDALDRLGQLTARTHCPTCGDASLDLVPRCDLGLRPCLLTARCEACGATYRIEPEATHAAAPATCPRCGSSSHRLVLQCDVASRDCTEVHVCTRCGTAVAAGDA